MRTVPHHSTYRPPLEKLPRLSAGRTTRPSHAEPAGPSRESLARLHSEAEALVQPFSLTASAKGRIDLGRTNLIRGMTHLYKRGGGEPKPHYHGNTDCFWLVLKGRARFYSADDETLGEFGPQEGTIIPAYARYRFINIGDGDLQILQVLAFHDRDRKDSGRVDLP
jgi:mannose-6-phosphate isomerase-like protein (cupin superfamily)